MQMHSPSGHIMKIEKVKPPNNESIKYSSKHFQSLAPRKHLD